MALPIVGGIIAAIAGAIAKLISIETLKLVVMRYLWVGLLTLTLPVVLYNVYAKIVKEVMNYANAQVAGAGMSATVWDFTSLGAWLAINMNLTGVFSIITSALIVRYTLHFIGK